MLLNVELSAFTALPGVLQAVVADDAGRLLGGAGGLPPPDMAVLVLAHATLSAAAEVGRRSGQGDCLEILQQHHNGVIYLRPVSQGRLLMVRCQSSEALPAVRGLCQRLMGTTASIPVQQAPSFPIDLTSALHAEPRW
ncbi:roadblock/LC7 domain-containing protein [Prosthecobacter sp.]|jgi:hypothetical protein|uniref:roadblock/LC7 domain-containing protein n=1 Tax=Prosthecobacter sp. TaxID=1965333 RepID=UPI0025F70F9F|nr:roadblock/LC7 domain-containing protein [Prosthecobacter sp.]